MSTKSHIESLVVGELDTNCYLLWCPQTYECLIIDPGDSGTAIIEIVLAKQLTPIGIVLTHGHFDHVLGLLEVQLAFGVPSFLHPADDFLIQRAQASAQHWLKHPVDPVPTATHQLSDQQLLQVGAQKLRVIHTPGHTPGSICLTSFFGSDDTADFEQKNAASDEILICGDLIFKEGYGRTDFVYAKTMQLFSSVDKLATELPKNTYCYPGHGESFYLADRVKTK